LQEILNKSIVVLAGSIATAPQTDVITDGIPGDNLKGNPHGLSANLIHWANSRHAPVVAIDTPSELDLTSGKTYGPVSEAAQL
jgi:NAD(P)H-hydrate repair Nnr-like enzyme with NAD(P)H-hydrate epimerase domain